MPLVVLAGKEYGSGSSRDWAAKGPKLLGVRAVIAESYERIHRSNLVGMGILPLQFATGESAASLGLTGEEMYDVDGVAEALASGFGNASGRDLKVKAHRADGSVKEFTAGCGSIRRRRCSTTSTAESCRTCCGSSSRRRGRTSPPGSPRAT